MLSVSSHLYKGYYLVLTVKPVIAFELMNDLPCDPGSVLLKIAQDILFHRTVSFSGFSKCVPLFIYAAFESLRLLCFHVSCQHEHCNTNSFSLVPLEETGLPKTSLSTRHIDGYQDASVVCALFCFPLIVPFPIYLNIKYQKQF